uniref:ZZ-type domain-containing protein n=2 Tax=Oryza meridionalis TaxID=40149 RepID=A0A0E0BWQ2_9ORYZ
MSPRQDAAPTAREGERDLVVKVKFGGTLKRFTAFVNGPHFDLNLAALRSKIASAFKFNPDTEFVLTYTDEDGDVVILDDDSDLCDAAICQRLNPLRINVELKSSSDGVHQTKQQILDSISVMSTALEDQLAQVKLAIDEALKFVPEQVPTVLAKISHDLRSKAASSAPPLADLLDRLAKLMAPKSKMQSSSGSADGSSGSSSGRGQTMGRLNIKNDTELMAVSASNPLDMHNSGSTKSLGLKGVLLDDIKAQAEHVSGYPYYVDTLSGWVKVDNKGSTNAQSNCKSVTSSAVPQVASIGHGAPTVHSAPASDCSEGLRSDLFWTQLGLSSEPFGPNGKIAGDLNSTCPPPPLFPRYPLQSLRADKSSNKGGSSYPPCICKSNTSKPENLSHYPVQSLQADRSFKGGRYFPPCTCKNNTSKPDNLSPVGLYGPYSEGSSCNRCPYRDLSDKHESMAQHTLHRWIQCDGCGVTPIAGSRYKSNIKDDYDLCNTCFSRMGNVNEYTRIDRPSFGSRRFRDLNQNQMLFPHLRQLHDCRFIKDITVPDGTVMAPSTPFTKIWRIHNNGSSMWPYGTSLTWVGGHLFARNSSVKLGISVDGFPIDQEIDVGVDFVTPAKPGGYVSYWRLASPTGQMFGQRVWVFIQVEHPGKTSSNKQSAAINLNMPPEGSNTEWKHSIDTNIQSADIVDEYSGSTITDPLAHTLYHEATKPMEPELVSSGAPSVPRAFESVLVPATDLLTSSAGAEKATKPAAVPAPAPQAIPLPKPVSIPASGPAPAPVSATTAAPIGAAAAPISEPTAPAAAIGMPSATARAASRLPTEPSSDHISAVEDNMLRELGQMGFGQVDLNKEIIRRNEYNLEQSIDELCGILEWDALHDELHELGI